jgi:putative hydrolase of the HAD superfamily
MIKCISWDFWSTLGLPNPHYPFFRTQYLCERYHLPEYVVNSSRKTAKKMLDERAKEGIGGECRLNLKGWLHSLLDCPVDESKDYDYLNDLFLKYPPVVFPEVMKAITAFKAANPHIKIGILSNTNFIPGEIISRASLTGIPFDFKIFSDEVGITKPNPKIFQMVMDRAGVSNPNEIIHIGDSLTFDAPAAEFGFQFRQVKHPTDILNILYEIF